jgi:hypothetical protein
MVIDLVGHSNSPEVPQEDCPLLVFHTLRNTAQRISYMAGFQNGIA